MRHLDSERPIDLECSGGCGKSVRIRPSKIRPADFFVCTPACESRLPAPPPGHVRRIVPNAAGGFFGVSFITEAEDSAIRRREEAERERERSAMSPEELAARVEAVDPRADLIECIYRGKGIYSAKLQTAISVYLDDGTAEEILAIVARDKQTASPTTCPFCMAAFDPQREDYCPSCGAAHALDGAQLAHRVLARVPDSRILALVASGDEIILSRRGENRLWARMPDQDAGAKLNALCEEIDGPEAVDRPTSREFPLMINEDLDADRREAMLSAPVIDADDLDDLNTYLVQLPTCAFCVHALPVSDHREGFASEPDLYCVRPLMGYEVVGQLGDEIQAGSQLSLSREDWQGVPLDNVAFRNTLWEAFLSRLQKIDATCLSGFAEGPIQAAHGPICPAFDLDPYPEGVHLGHYDQAKATVPVRFMHLVRNARR